MQITQISLMEETEMTTLDEKIENGGILKGIRECINTLAKHVETSRVEDRGPLQAGIRVLEKLLPPVPVQGPELPLDLKPKETAPAAAVATTQAGGEATPPQV